MSDDPLDEIRADLDRAEDLEAEAAVEVLESAEAELERLREDGSASVDEETLRSLEDRLDQRLRAVRERDAYDGALGAATEPEEEDAP